MAVERTILAGEYKDTPKGEKGPQKATEPHRTEYSACEGCPESVVIFDESGVHGIVPDTRSRTCRACEHNDRGAGQ